MTVAMWGGMLSPVPYLNAAASTKKMPAAFDLRHVGGTTAVKNGKTVFSGGNNYVTQAKFQNPWTSCWSFASTAAAETSILYEKGITNEQYKALTGKEYNLSEKALVWYAFHHISDKDVCDDVPASQVGEGVHLGEGSESDPNFAYDDTGGCLFYTSSLYSQGCGPKDEEYRFPGETNEYPYAYRGNNGWTMYDQWTLPEIADKAKDALRKDLKEAFPDYSDAEIEAALQRNMAPDLEGGTGEGKSYSKYDNWSIPVDHQHRSDVSDAVLQDSHILPSPANHDDNDHFTGNNPAGIEAIKKEVLSGRPVSICYSSDQSRPGDAIGEDTCINTETWAQYVFNPDSGINHGVAIVGFDDNYSKDNFLKGTFTAADGTICDKNPGKDGAFICKNSWGCLHDETPGQHNKGQFGKGWGINGDGYFYLSYYDKSIQLPESFDFYSEKDTDAPKSDQYYINQYDFMPKSRVKSKSADAEISMANVFTAGHDQKLTHISTLTNEQNTEVHYEIYKLNSNAANPRDGRLVASGIKTFEFGGYHRIALGNDVLLPKGTKFSVVTSQVTYPGGASGRKYYELLFASTDKEEWYQGKIQYTVTGVVNKGESFAFVDNKWYDWSEIITDIAEPIAKESGKNLSYDNPSIKAYSVPATAAEVSKATKVSAVKLGKTNLTMGKGQSFTLQAAVLPLTATNKDIKWKSSNEKIAKVENGVVKAIGKGTATITATAKDGSGKKDKCRVSVTDKKVVFVKEISLNNYSLDMIKGNSAKLKAKVVPKNAKDKKVKWVSSNTKVATVSGSGKVTAKSPGKAVITAFAGEAMTTCSVSVRPAVKSISLKAKRKTLSVGKTYPIIPTVKPSDAGYDTLTYTSSNKAVATVESGIVKAKKRGTATITVKAGKKTARCAIKVK